MSEWKTTINVEFQRLYDEGMREGKHGHYETMFAAMHAAYAPHLRALQDAVDSFSATSCQDAERFAELQIQAVALLPTHHIGDER
jgi:hypothetical protein